MARVVVTPVVTVIRGGPSHSADCWRLEFGLEVLGVNVVVTVKLGV